VTRAIKELLDDDVALRRRFRSCASTRRSTAPMEVEHWIENLREERGMSCAPGAVEAALARLTVALLPSSLSGIELAERVAANTAQAEADAACTGVVGDPAPDGAASLLDEPWDPAWASELMARAIRGMAEALPEDADPPALDAETAEVNAAADAEDRERYSRAVAAWAEAARTVPPAPEDGTSTDPTWNEDWAQDEIARALVYVDARVASGAAPAADDEWREVHAATEARDEARLRAAVKAAVKASLRTLRREGRLLPEPERGGSPGSSAA
jgi:Na+-transporting methylmalonyl-CoA/oxaloacetate decarboxylase gamma subunit